MDLREFKNDIVKHELKNVYLLTGDEIGMMNLYIAEIGEGVKRVDSLSEAWKNLTNDSLFSDKSTYVIRDDMNVLKDESIHKKIKEIKKNTVIFVYTKIDKRSKLRTLLKDVHVEFDKMTETQLFKYYKNSAKGLSDTLLKALIKRCDNDFSRIGNEIDKLDSLAAETGSKVDLDILESVVFRQQDTNIFEITNAIIKYDIPTAVEHTRLNLARGESPIPILSIVRNNFKLAAKIFLTSKEVKADEIGTTPFMLGMIKRDFSYSDGSIIKGIKILNDAIEGIKVGKYRESDVLYIVLAKLDKL